MPAEKLACFLADMMVYGIIFSQWPLKSAENTKQAGQSKNMSISGKNMKHRDLSIGFFDSGVGGLSVLKHAREQLPKENFIFYGDNAHAPYGERSEEEIRALSFACCDQLFERGVKALLVACNTATGAAIHAMRERYQIPVVSIEPAIKPASESQEEGKILVLATPFTIQGARYHRLVERVGCEDRLIQIPCKGLADLVEKGEFESQEIAEYLQKKFEQFPAQPISGIVIGCTHYSFIAPLIQKVAKQRFAGSCTLYDGRYGTVRQLRRVLEQDQMLSEKGNASCEILSSGGAESVALMRRILEA